MKSTRRDPTRGSARRKPRAYEADLTWVDGRFRTGTIVVEKDGVITAFADKVPVNAERVRLRGRALLPGMINAHSHAFQRVIRGRTEHRAPGHESDDFWSWREEMYSAANKLDDEGLHVASRMAYLEMLLAGITTVGEFHYLHNDRDGGPSDTADLATLLAANVVGIRTVFLRVCYQRGGFDVPLDARQKRFVETTEAFKANTLKLRDDTQASRYKVAVGVAPHSVRAVPPDVIRELVAFAREKGMPIHLHASEQRGEVEACHRATGLRPVELLDSLGALGPDVTLVHGIHLSPREIELIGKSGTSVCACPTTERNLGDGIVPAGALLDAGAHLCLGTDSQAQIDLLEDARALEYHLRLLEEKRAVLDRPGKQLDRTALARKLFDAATVEGARSLGVQGGRIAVGQPADFFTVSLEDPCVAGATEEDLIAAIVFGLERTAIIDVIVAGRRLVEEGNAGKSQASIVEDYVALQKKLWRDA